MNNVQKLADKFPDNLPPRQRLILAYQMLGKSQKEIKELLDLSVSTIELDLSKARSVLGIEKTREAFWFVLDKL